MWCIMELQSAPSLAQKLLTSKGWSTVMNVSGACSYVLG